MKVIEKKKKDYDDEQAGTGMTRRRKLGYPTYTRREWKGYEEERKDMLCMEGRDVSFFLPNASSSSLWGMGGAFGPCLSLKDTKGRLLSPFAPGWWSRWIGLQAMSPAPGRTREGGRTFFLGFDGTYLFASFISYIPWWSWKPSYGLLIYILLKCLTQ